jgi:hypothetical protein
MAIGIKAAKVKTVRRQRLWVIVALCVVTSVCSARKGRSSKFDKYRKPRPDSSRQTAPTWMAPPGYNTGVERSKFFIAAGKDNELDDKEFNSDRSKSNGFVRKTDNWAAMLRYDRDGNRTLDWFEADAYRRSRYRTTGSGSSSRAASTSRAPAQSGYVTERSKFFAAAGPDNDSDRSKSNGFVRKTDNWAAMLRYDKDGNGTIDWFEAEAYRRPQHKTTPVKVTPSAEASFGGHRYKVIRKRISWEAAAKECRTLRGHLVTIESSEELAFVKRLAGSSRLWVGATDRSREGRWEWLGGKSVSQVRSLWASGEPNGGKACNYASITSRGLYDSSSPYASVSGMICELAK